MLKIFKWYDSYVEWFICYGKNKKKYGIKFIYSRFNVLKKLNLYFIVSYN